MLLRIYRAVFYPSLIMGLPSSLFILELFPVPSLFYLITVSLRLLPRTVPEEANLPGSYRSILSQFRSFFCSSLHAYREKIGLIPSSICSSCGVEPHTNVHVFSSSSQPTPLSKLDLWERPRLASEFLSVLPFFDLQRSTHITPQTMTSLGCNLSLLWQNRNAYLCAIANIASIVSAE